MLTRLLHKPRGTETILGHPGETQEDRNYRYLLINGAIFGLVDGGILNYLPVFLARLGASPAIVGLLTSGPSMIGILAYVPGGAFAERHRDLVKLTAWTSLIARLFYPLIALAPLFMAPAHVPFAVVILWSLTALPNAVLVPAWTSVMQKAVSPRRRARLNGTRWALLSIVSACAIALFGYFLDHASFPAGYQIVFLISFIAAVANLYPWVQVRVPPFVREDNHGAPPATLGARLSTFLHEFSGHRAFVNYNIASLIYRLALSIPVGLFSIFWVQDLNASNTLIGLRGTAGYAALVIGYRFWGSTANRLGHRNLLLICGAALGAYPILTAFSPTAEWLLLSAVLWGLTAAGVDIGLFDMLLATCPDSRQPTFIAASNMLTSIAAAVGPFLGAALAAIAGIRGALLITGGLQVLCTASFLLLPGRDQEELN